MKEGIKASSAQNPKLEGFQVWVCEAFPFIKGEMSVPLRERGLAIASHTGKGLIHNQEKINSAFLALH